MENETKKSKKGLIAVLAIIIIAIIVGVVYYFLRPVSPKDLFISQIDETMNKSNVSAKSNAEKINSTITLSGNIEATNQKIAQIAEIINDGKITLNVQADTNAKKAALEANINYKNEDLIDAKVFYQSGDNNIYLLVKDLFDKYFKINAEEMQSDEEMTSMVSGIKDVSTASQIIKDTISENLKDEYFSKENADGLTKNTMKLSATELENLLVNILTALRDNEKFVNCFEESNKIKEKLNEAIKSIKEENKENNNANIEISLYTKGNSKDVQKAEFKIDISETEGATLTINKIDENNAEFNLEVKGTSNNTPFIAQPLKGTIRQEKVDNNTTKMVIIVDNVPEVGKVTLNMEIKNSDTTDLDSIDVSNSVELDKITETEMMTLFKNLQNMKIYPYIAPYMGQLIGTE